MKFGDTESEIIIKQITNSYSSKANFNIPPIMKTSSHTMCFQSWNDPTKKKEKQSTFPSIHIMSFI